VTERGGDGGGSRTLGVVERGRRPGTEAGPGGGRVQRQHRGRSMTKCGSGGAEVEEAARQVCGRNFFYFFMQKEGIVTHPSRQLRSSTAAAAEVVRWARGCQG
jgi:hypothetical protein